ncbi:MAG: hypothetical protein GY845_20670 [Planctomycetes bacterium]|nr:hypothetical protein [Planctomycetota bacterium]
MKWMLKLISVSLICLVYLSNASAAIRVVAYNCYNRPNDATQDSQFRTIFQAIGDQSVNGIAERLDILVMSETDPSSADRLTTVLNDLYNVGTYTHVLSSSVGGDRTGVIYDANAVSLVAFVNLTTIGTHPILRAHFRLHRYTGSSLDFYIYAIHLKSGSSVSDIAQRAAEVANLRNDADALGQGAQIIYAGDFNMTGSSEGAWMNLLAAGNGQASDPANAPGQWRDNNAFRHLHTQNPNAAMDDRFDFQFITDEFSDNNGIDYVANSFRVFGNDGTHTLNGTITTGTGASSNVLSALAIVSDHLPVVADYTVKSANPLRVRMPIDDIRSTPPGDSLPFNLPTSMLIKENIVIEMTLALSSLQALLPQNMATEMARGQVPDSLEAKLSSNGFKILDIMPAKQHFDSNQTTQWRWDVTATETGPQKLYLTLSAHYADYNSETYEQLKTYEPVIKIKITWLQRITRFFSIHWKWVWAAILAPFIAFFWKRRKKKDAKDKENSEG